MIVIHRLAEYASLHGLTTDAIAISYRTLAEILSVGSTHAHRLVRQAATEGRLVIVDKATLGPKGVPAILGIVEAGERPEETLQRFSDGSAGYGTHPGGLWSMQNG